LCEPFKAGGCSFIEGDDEPVVVRDLDATRYPPEISLHPHGDMIAAVDYL
jgi:hypothetical protein